MPSDWGEFRTCPTCHEYRWTGMPHTCPSRWRVEYPAVDMIGDDGWMIRARNAEHAAEKFAELHEGDGDYTIIGGAECVVTVTREGSDEPGETFDVTGESVPQYSARKKG